MEKIKIYLSQWTIMRFLRLIMGILIVIQGVKAEQWLIAGIGVLFSILPLFNMGCGVNGTCDIPNRKN